MLKQMKGKTLDKVPNSKLLESNYFWSIKRDGNYFQIIKKGEDIKFFTSGGKEFYWSDVAKNLKNIEFDFAIEGEYTGYSDGKLGDRRVSTLTTDRVEFSKGRTTTLGTRNIWIFDIIDCSIIDCSSTKFANRYGFLLNHLFMLNIVKQIPLDKFNYLEILTPYIKDGYEGIMLKHRDNLVQHGKRVNDILKIKSPQTIKLKCLACNPGEGRLTGLIGSLKLIDSEGRLVDVGSGMNDEDRQRPKSYYEGKFVQIGYEQLLNTYIQPTYLFTHKETT